MDLERMLAMQDGEVARLSLGELRRLRGVFEDSRRRLKRELSEWEGRGEGDLYSAAKRREALLRVARVIAVTEERLGVRLLEGAEEARELAARHLAAQVAVGRETMGDLGRLDLGGVGRVSREVLAERSQGFAKKWGERAVQRTKDILAEGLARGAGLGDLVNDLTGTGGPLEGDRYAAARLVRTELSHHYNQRTLEGLEDAAKGAEAAGRPKPKKRLVHVVDDRTASDSLAIMGWPDNVVKEVDEDFWDPVAGRGFAAPPNRPNDRARLVFYFGTAREDAGIGRERAAAEAEELRREKGEVRKGPGRASASALRATADRSASASGASADRSALGPSATAADGGVSGGSAVAGVWTPGTDRGVARASVVGSVGTEYQKRSLATFEKVIRGSRVEIGGTLRRSGGIRRPMVGDSGLVGLEIPRGETGLITVHNHPRGGSFSLDDFFEAEEFGSRIVEMRVVGLLPDGRGVTYVARMGGKRIDRWAIEELDWDRRSRNLDEVPEIDRYHVRNTVLSEIVGFYYERFIED